MSPLIKKLSKINRLAKFRFPWSKKSTDEVSVTNVVGISVFANFLHKMLDFILIP